jgi:putative DNA primase/helicase
MSHDKIRPTTRTIVQCAPDPDHQEIYAAALAYRRAGLSIIPIATGGEKAPAHWLLPYADDRSRRHTWKPYQKEPASTDEIGDWFDPRIDGPEVGIGIVAGAVSGGLEILDLDNFAVVKPFVEEVKKRAPGLIRKLVKVKTPRPGLHLYYRCAEIGGSEKLAQILDPDAPPEKPKPKTIIETKGEKGYALAPPSPATCHPRDRCYVFVGDRDLTMVPTISVDERKTLHDVARSFNHWTNAPKKQYVPARQPITPGAPLRPGDAFNLRADWYEILEPHGWQCADQSEDGTARWVRPGKDFGISATTNYEGRDLLYVFSSNADPFEANTGYTKFHAHVLLNFDGDYQRAAQSLVDQGFGALRRRNPMSNSFARYRSAGQTLQRLGINTMPSPSDRYRKASAALQSLKRGTVT